jgi:hypothetical protein
LGGGDVEVCQNAALVLPAATNAPVTLAAGQAISGGGTVLGTLALATNAVVDVAQNGALTLDDLWLAAGAVVRWHHAGAAADTLKVDTLKTAATAVLEVAGGDDLPVRAHVIAYSSGEGLAGTVWTVRGGKANSRVEVNSALRTIDLVTPRGTAILVR